MRQLLIAVAALALVALVEAGLHIYRWKDEQARDELRRRLKAIGEQVGEQQTLLRAGKFAATPALDAFLRTVPLARRIERLLEQADSRFTVAQIVGYTVLLASAGLTIGVVIGTGIPACAILIAVCAALPLVLLLMARDRRSRKLSEQLPEALDMMARSLRAGHALSSAFELVAKEMPEPVAVEFGRAFEAQRLGIPVDQAIVQMTERLPANRDLKIFAVSAVIQKETGGNLAEIMSQLAETIRARYRFYGKLRSLTAEGRASAVLVGAMPFLVTFFIHLMNPGYLTPLVTTGPGHIILAGACTSWVLGVGWLYRMTQLDV